MGWLSIGASLLGGLFGGKSKPAKSSSVSGWQALPQEVKDVYLKSYLPGVQQFYDTPMSDAVKSVYDSYGGGVQGLMSELPQYMKVFQQNVDDPTFRRMQQETDIEKNRLNALAANSGLGGLFNSNLGIQQSQLQNNADERKANYAYQMNQNNFTNGLNLRNQTLGELLKSQNGQFDRLNQLSSLLGAFKEGSTQSSTGGSSGPNFWDKLAGGATSIDALGQQQNWW